MLNLFLLGAAFAAEDPFAMSPTVHVLPNGLTVILEENHRTDSVALHVTYGVGSRDERPGEYGCAHLFEHLMFEGSRNVPTFDNWLTAAGGWNNAYTSEDVTAYHMAFPSGALELALFLESDRMGFLDAGLTDVNVANQQAVVLQERAEGFAEPNGRDWDAMSRIVWPDDHPYHHPVIGTVADVDGFETPAVLDFWKRHYRPRNAVLALVGNFETEEALAMVQRWFSDVPDPGAPGPRVTEAPLVGGGQIGPAEGAPRHGLVEDDVEERTVYLTWHTVPLLHQDEAALNVLGLILSSGRGTRVDDALYLESKQATSAGAFHYPSEIGGLFIATASAPDTSLAKLEKALLAQIASLATTPPSAAELERAKQILRGSLLDPLESNESRAEILVECQRTEGRPDCLGAEWERVVAVTADDVVAAAQKYLKAEARTTLSIVPRGDDGALPGAVAVELP